MSFGSHQHGLLLTLPATAASPHPGWLTVCLQLFRQLEALHSLDLVHSDLKMENILVKLCPETGEVVDMQLADWGAAMHLDGAYAREAG